MRVAIELTDHWDLVAPTGELLRRAAVVALGEGPTSDQVSIASRELLENIVKYSHGDEASISLQVNEKNVRVVAENRPDPVHLATLKDELDQLSKLAPGEALQHYIGRMAIAAVAVVGKSGLGLARIRYECGMTLSMETLGARVRIVAQRKV